MAQLARLRTGALALPEVEEGTHFGMVAFSVRGKGFASLSKDGALVHFQLPGDRIEALVAELPEAEPLVRMGTPIGVSVPLAGLDVRVLDRLLREAWEARAPKRLVAAHSADAQAVPTGDLPPIGRPATAALALAGITTMDQVAERTDKELADLHGVGPTAIRLLREALAAQGRGFRAG
jgi:hypothetical protein